MTAVAERASASIGTLYDYFPDKRCLAQALAGEYATEADQHWKALLGGPLPSGRDAFADLLVDGALAFIRERPAYLPLFGSPFITFRSPAARQHLRRAFAKGLLRIEPELTSEDALVKGQVIVELVKALLAAYRQIAPEKHDLVTAEFKRLVRFYISG